MSATVTTFPSADTGLAAELRMLGSVAEGAGSCFLIWQASARALVLPDRFSRQSEFINAADASALAGWPVTTRRTGGGITPQGPGVVNVAVAFQVPPKDARSVAHSYAAICDPLAETLRGIGIDAKPGAVPGSFCDGDFNLEVEGRKVVGTAQRWRGKTVLCHALVLMDVSIPNAVDAAQRLSDALGLGDIYRVDAHTSLTTAAPSATSEIFGRGLVKAMTARGHIQFAIAET